MSHPDPIPTPASAEPPPTNMHPMSQSFNPGIVPPIMGSMMRHKRWAGQIVEEVTHGLTSTIPPKPESDDAMDNILWGVEVASPIVSIPADVIDAMGGPIAISQAAMGLPSPVREVVTYFVTGIHATDKTLKALPPLLRGTRDLREQRPVPDSEPRYPSSAPRLPALVDKLQLDHQAWLAKKTFNDRADLDKHMLDFVMPSYQPGDWQQEFLDDSGFGGGHAVSYQLPGDLRVLGSASGQVTARTWLLGNTLEHDLAPALSGAVDSITPADIAFGEMDMGYDGLTWVTGDLREVLTVNTAAMSGALTQWAAAVSEENEQRRREVEAMLRQPAPAARSDSPPGGGSSGGGLSWHEGLDLYQRRSGETAQNIEWMRARPDDKAESGPNAGWTFREIVQDAVKKSDLVPVFAMGGIVPGMVGTPVPAVVHGGERIVGAGNAGGIPINLEVHVHGTVISEGDLAKNVRDGLMRRLS